MVAKTSNKSLVKLSNNFYGSLTSLKSNFGFLKLILTTMLPMLRMAFVFFKQSNFHDKKQPLKKLGLKKYGAMLSLMGWSSKFTNQQVKNIKGFNKLIKDKTFKFPINYEPKEDIPRQTRQRNKKQAWEIYLSEKSHND